MNKLGPSEPAAHVLETQDPTGGRREVSQEPAELSGKKLTVSGVKAITKHNPDTISPQYARFDHSHAV